MNSVSTSVDIRVLFFAKARELAGFNETRISLEAPKSYLALDLLRILCERYNLEEIKDNIILAINENYCDSLRDTVELKAGDEIAIIPPLSGG